MISPNDPVYIILLIFALALIQQKTRLWRHGWSLISKTHGYSESFEGTLLGNKVIYAKSPSSSTRPWKLAVLRISVNKQYIYFAPLFPYSKMMKSVMFSHDSIKVEYNKEHKNDVYISFLELKNADFYMYKKDYDDIQEKISNYCK